MYGSVIGDLAGSIYEYDQTKGIKNIKVDNLINDNSFYSDDTILTIAIIDAILHDKDYEKYLKMYIEKYKDYKPNFKPYFKTSFSPGLIKWAEGKKEGNSHGNGAMMRISGVGYLFDRKIDVLEHARLATIPSHNSKESIDAATKIALLIYYFRNGFSKEEVLDRFKFDLKHEPFTRFNTTCNETINNCLYSIFNTSSFEDSIKEVISYGGDTDTNACIVGSVSESIYGIDRDLINQANEHIPEEFQMVLRKTGYYR